MQLLVQIRAAYVVNVVAAQIQQLRKEKLLALISVERVPAARKYWAITIEPLVGILYRR